MLISFYYVILILIGHRNIVSLRGICITEDDFMIITEYMGRGTLDDSVLNLNYQFENHHKKLLALDCCFGMNYLHNVGIIHRDLKGIHFSLSYTL
jgi:serine/threonine protein kinase